MEDFRSRSYGEGRASDIQQHRSDGPNRFAVNNMQNLRSYSTSYAEHPTRNQTADDPDQDPRKERSMNRTGSGWGLGDPDLRRKKRVASYRAYTVEGKLKGSFRKSFKWIKDRCSKLAHAL
ncbi:PREDICTED: uncharacterized protein LOC104820019 [Tarenaya hassleriana]|uniref:uncharacterized protein LOC104820019 n=1 Tax=Tarenaya hassleriana TaxID=28532 RepID=UPI00053C1066|nr:PREDICTED: uncharacterized protein LOC104820019 [Tarenaya hassleriana]